jgi:hypothetical protein
LCAGPLERPALLPVMLDSVAHPVAFGAAQAIDLKGRTGRGDDPRWLC